MSRESAQVHVSHDSHYLGKKHDDIGPVTRQKGRQ
jgi:hypothetical protein